MTVESGCLGFGLGFGLGASGGAGSSMNPGCLGFAFGFGLGELGGAGSSLCDNESCNCEISSTIKGICEVQVSP